MNLKPRSGMHLSLILLALLNMVPAVEVEQSWHLLLLAGVAAAFSILLARPDGSNRMPPWGIHVMVGSAAIFLIYEMFFPQDEPTVYIIDLAHFMMFLGCCKFFEMKTYRDYGLVATIAFLLLIISAFASGSPLFGIVLAIDLTLGLAWVLSFQSRREATLVHARLAAAIPSAGGRRAIHTHGEVIRRHGFIAPAMLFAIVMVIFAGLVFLAVPRGWGKGIFVRIQGVMPTSVTGYSGDITLEDGNLIEDDTPVMKVMFKQDGRVLSEGDITPYLRGRTLERYDRGRWFPSKNAGKLSIQLDDNGSAPPLTRLGNLQRSPKVLEQQVWLDNLSTGSLFTEYPPLEFVSTDISRMRLNMGDLSLQTDERPRKGVRYTIRTLKDLSADDRLILDPPPENPFRPGRLSAIHPEVRRFAREFFEQHGDADDPLQRRKLATALADHLASGEYDYTLNRATRLGGADPVRDFLFIHKRGHCEYFASAMTLVCQAAGIPARIVNGYMGGEFNESGGFFQFRQRDAHAWVEVFVADEGWIIFDPSPATETRLRGEEQGFFAAARHFFDLMQFKWSTVIVAFDSENWYAMVESLASWVEKLQKGGEKSGTGVTLLSILWGPDLLLLWQRCFYWLLLILVVTFVVLVLRALGILSLMLKENLGAGRGRRGARVRKLDARFYDRLLLLLANKGYVKLPHHSPLEFARDLARANRDLAELPVITEWFYEAQYGHHALDRARSTRIKGFLARLREDASFGARSNLN